MLIPINDLVRKSYIIMSHHFLLTIYLLGKLLDVLVWTSVSIVFFSEKLEDRDGKEMRGKVQFSTKQAHPPGLNPLMSCLLLAFLKFS